MKEVFKNLFVGNDSDYYYLVSQKTDSEYLIVHAAKEPYHRQFVGYLSRGCDSQSHEYYIAKRGNEIALNMVDSPYPKFFHKIMIDGALAFIDDGLKNGQKVFIHCNCGRSRAPSLAILYLGRIAKVWGEVSFFGAQEKFVERYHDFYPGFGIYQYLEESWMKYGAGN